MNPQSETAGVSKAARGFGIAVVLAGLANSLLVVVKEKSPALQAEMKKLTGHHWITHAVAIIGLFLIAGWLGSRLNLRFTAGKLITTLVAGVAVAAAIIFGFYLIAD